MYIPALSDYIETVHQLPGNDGKVIYLECDYLDVAKFAKLSKLDIAQGTTITTSEIRSVAQILGYS